MSAGVIEVASIGTTEEAVELEQGVNENGLLAQGAKGVVITGDLSLSQIESGLLSLVFGEIEIVVRAIGSDGNECIGEKLAVVDDIVGLRHTTRRCRADLEAVDFLAGVNAGRRYVERNRLFLQEEPGVVGRLEEHRVVVDGSRRAAVERTRAVVDEVGVVASRQFYDVIEPPRSCADGALEQLHLVESMAYPWPASQRGRHYY